MIDGNSTVEEATEAVRQERLIAAAPALYEALRRMLADVEAYQANPYGHSPTSQIANARAALALVSKPQTKTP